jgi:hypothetical protein
MVNIVEYILQLKGGQFQTGIAEAQHSTNALEASIGNLKSSAMSFAGILAGAFASFEFLSGSVEMFNEAEQASAQLNATMASTKNIAHLNRQALDEQSEALMKTSLFDDDVITSSQALLATFTKVKDTIYMEAIPAIVDMSTKMGGDLQGTTLQVGKALNDPIKGITALSRAGVSFTAEQKKTIQTMVDMNDVAGAQRIILQELSTEFSGSALAAAEAGTGPFTVLKNEFNNTREEIGALVVSLGKELLPVFKDFTNAIKNGVEFIKEHKDGIHALIKGIVIGYGVYKLITGFQYAYNLALTLGTPLIRTFTFALATGCTTIEATAVATSGLGTAMSAALGPIGLIVAAIGAATLALDYFNSKYDEAIERQNEQNKTERTGTIAVLSAEYEESQKKSGLSKADFIKKEGEKLNAEQKKVNDETKALLYDNALNKNELKLPSSGDLQLRKEALESYKTGAVKPATDAPTTGALKSAAGVKPAKVDSSKTQAVGSKSVTINVSIKDLIGTYNMNTTNLKEGLNNVREQIVATLTGAVNDFQIVAGQ